MEVRPTRLCLKQDEELSPQVDEAYPEWKPWVENLEALNLKYEPKVEAVSKPVDFYSSFCWAFSEMGNYQFGELKATSELMESEELRQQALGGARVLLDLYADLAQQHAALHTEVRRLRQGEAIDNAELLQRSRALQTVTQERDTLASQLTAARQAGVAKEAEVLRRGRGILGWARRAERAEGEVARLRVEAAEKDAELGRRAAEIKALEVRCVAAEEEVHRRREASNEVERLMAELEEQDAQLGRRQDMLMSTLQRCTAAEAEAEMLRGMAAGDQQTITELKEAWWASAEDYRVARNGRAVAEEELTDSQAAVELLQLENLELRLQVAGLDADSPTPADSAHSRRCQSAPARKAKRVSRQEPAPAPASGVTVTSSSLDLDSGNDRIGAFRPVHRYAEVATAEQQDVSWDPSLLESCWDDWALEGLHMWSTMSEADDLSITGDSSDGNFQEALAADQLDKPLPISLIDPLWDSDEEYGCLEEDFSDFGWGTLRGGRVLCLPKGTVRVGETLMWEEDFMRWEADGVRWEVDELAW